MFEISDLKRRDSLRLRSVRSSTRDGRSGRVPLIFSYICRLGLFLGVQNFEFHYFFIYFFFQKTEYFGGYENFVDIFGGYEDFVDIFGGSSQN